MRISDRCCTPYTATPTYSSTVGANTFERRRRKVSFLKSPYLWSQNRYWSAVFLKTPWWLWVYSQKIVALQLERFLREVRYNLVIFCRFFSPFFVKYTMVVIHFDIFIENNFFGCILLQDDRKKMLKNI
jgi:hypothetical protein